jgi:23S rRNA (uracil1939-C5)-methyltransferase
MFLAMYEDGAFRPKLADRLGERHPHYDGIEDQRKKPTTVGRTKRMAIPPSDRTRSKKFRSMECSWEDEELTFLFNLSRSRGVAPSPSSAPPPEILTVTVSDLSRGGAGVAREPGGRVIFVPRSAPGDRLRVRLVSEKKHYAQAEIVEVLERSPLRQDAPCPVFGRCGGCEWQHLPYELQWKTKASGSRHALERVGLAVPDADWREFPAERVWQYRNRVQLRGKGGEIGFFAARSHDLVAIDHCPIARPEINAALGETRAEGAGLGREYKVEVEVLADGRLRKTWNSGHAAAGFRQVHDEQNALLQSYVASRLSPGRLLLDLYGGSGNLSLALAGTMSEIHCVDLGSPAQAPAGTPPNFRFHRSAVLPWLLRQAPSGAPVSAVLDPPREGVGEQFSEIAARLEKLGCDEIVAVGCEADSWARDLSRFARRGWTLRAAAALDFFPQTHHVESVGFLTR